jgi:hypothetical protein
VSQFVSDDALKFIAGELVAQARGDRDDALLRIAASGEGIGAVSSMT